MRRGIRYKINSGLICISFIDKDSEHFFCIYWPFVQKYHSTVLRNGYNFLGSKSGCMRKKLAEGVKVCKGVEESKFSDLKFYYHIASSF
jgi:hypothetical protein